MKNKKFIVYKAKTIVRNNSIVTVLDGEPIFITSRLNQLSRFLNNVTFNVTLRYGL